MPKSYPTDYDWWINESSRKFRKYGTLLAAFNADFATHKTLALANSAQIGTLDGLYSAWIKSKGGTKDQLNTAREPQATQLRRKLVQACDDAGIASLCTMAGPMIAMDLLAPLDVPKIDVPKPKVRRSGGTPLDWVNEVKAELNRFNEKNYAVNDAVAFSGDIAPGKHDIVLGKLAAVQKTSPSLVWTVADAMMPRGSTEWNESTLAPTYRRLTGKTPDASLGVCTSFAKAAAYILTKDRPHGPLVEFVSFTGRRGVAHVYVVVGRAGGYAEGNKLPDPSTWGDQTVIVDAWLGAMGYNVIFGIHDFPKYGYLTNAKADMIRDAA